MDCRTPGPLSITNSQSLLILMSTESAVPSNHVILCRPLLLLPSYLSDPSYWSRISWFFIPLLKKYRDCGLVAQLCPILCNLMEKHLHLNEKLYGLLPDRLLCPWNFLGKNTRVGCHFLLQRNFPTQGCNSRRLHCRQILYWLSHQGSPNLLATWVVRYNHRSVAGRGTHSRAQEWTLIQYLGMNCPRRHTYWQRKRLYWEGTSKPRAAG